MATNFEVIIKAALDNKSFKNAAKTSTKIVGTAISNILTEFKETNKKAGRAGGKAGENYKKQLLEQIGKSKSKFVKSAARQLKILETEQKNHKALVDDVTKSYDSLSDAIKKTPAGSKRGLEKVLREGLPEFRQQSKGKDRRKRAAGSEEVDISGKLVESNNKLAKSYDETTNASKRHGNQLAIREKEFEEFSESPEEAALALKTFRDEYQRLRIDIEKLIGVKNSFDAIKIAVSLTRDQIKQYQKDLAKVETDKFTGQFAGPPSLDKTWKEAEKKNKDFDKSRADITKKYSEALKINALKIRESIEDQEKATKAVDAFYEIHKRLNAELKKITGKDENYDAITISASKAKKQIKDLGEAVDSTTKSQKKGTEAQEEATETTNKAEEHTKKYEKALRLKEISVREAGGSTKKFHKILERLNIELSKKTGKEKNIEAISIATREATRRFSKWQTELSKVLIGFGALGVARRIIGDIAGGIANIARGITSLARKSAQLSDMEVAFKKLASEEGNAAVALNQIRTAAGGVIDDYTLLQTSTTALVAGLPVGRLPDIIKGARALAAVTGREVPDAIERMTNAIVKQERRLLDELGIVVRAEDIYRDYAKAHDLVGDSLTANQKKLAFLEGTLEAVNEKVERLGGILEDAQRPFLEFDESLRQLGINFGEAVNRFSPFNTLLRTATSLVSELSSKFETTVDKALKLASIVDTYKKDQQNKKDKKEGIFSLLLPKEESALERFRDQRGKQAAEDLPGALSEAAEESKENLKEAERALQKYTVEIELIREKGIKSPIISPLLSTLGTFNPAGHPIFQVLKHLKTARRPPTDLQKDAIETTLKFLQNQVKASEAELKGIQKFLIGIFEERYPSLPRLDIKLLDDKDREDTKKVEQWKKDRLEKITQWRKDIDFIIQKESIELQTKKVAGILNFHPNQVERKWEIDKEELDPLVVAKEYKRLIEEYGAQLLTDPFKPAVTKTGTEVDKIVEDAAKVAEALSNLRKPVKNVLDPEENIDVYETQLKKLERVYQDTLDVLTAASDAFYKERKKETIKDLVEEQEAILELKVGSKERKEREEKLSKDLSKHEIEKQSIHTIMKLNTNKEQARLNLAKHQIKKVTKLEEALDNARERAKMGAAKTQYERDIAGIDALLEEDLKREGLSDKQKEEFKEASEKHKAGVEAKYRRRQKAELKKHTEEAERMRLGIEENGFEARIQAERDHLKKWVADNKGSTRESQDFVVEYTKVTNAKIRAIRTEQREKEAEDLKAFWEKIEKFADKAKIKNEDTPLMQELRRIETEAKNLREEAEKIRRPHNVKGFTLDPKETVSLMSFFDKAIDETSMKNQAAVRKRYHKILDEEITQLKNIAELESVPSSKYAKFDKKDLQIEQNKEELLNKIKNQYGDDQKKKREELITELDNITKSRTVANEKQRVEFAVKGEKTLLKKIQDIRDGWEVKSERTRFARQRLQSDQRLKEGLDLLDEFEKNNKDREKEINEEKEKLKIAHAGENTRIDSNEKAADIKRQIQFTSREMGIIDRSFKDKLKLSREFYKLKEQLATHNFEIEQKQIKEDIRIFSEELRKLEAAKPKGEAETELQNEEIKKKEEEIKSKHNEVEKNVKEHNQELELLNQEGSGNRTATIEKEMNMWKGNLFSVINDFKIFSDKSSRVLEGIANTAISVFSDGKFGFNDAVTIGVKAVSVITGIFRKSTEAAKKQREESFKLMNDLEKRGISAASSIGSAMSEALKEGTKPDFKEMVRAFVESKFAESVADSINKLVGPDAALLDMSIGSEILDNKTFLDKFREESKSHLVQVRKDIKDGILPASEVFKAVQKIDPTISIGIKDELDRLDRIQNQVKPETKQERDKRLAFEERHDIRYRYIFPKTHSIDAIRANRAFVLTQIQELIDENNEFGEAFAAVLLQGRSIGTAGKHAIAISGDLKKITPQLEQIQKSLGFDSVDDSSKLSEITPTATFSAATQPQFNTHLLLMTQQVGFLSTIAQNTAQLVRLQQGQPVAPNSNLSLNQDVETRIGRVKSHQGISIN